MRFFAAILEQSVLGNLLYVVVIVAGLFALQRMPVEEYPNVSFNRARISTLCPGASAEDVERLVTREIEDEIEDVKGIAHIDSVSVQGFSRIVVQFEDDIPDFEGACRDLESEVRRVHDLPALTEPPEIERIDIESLNPVIYVTVYGDAPEETLKTTAEELERRLEEVPGVRRCRTFGLRDREVHIEVDPERLAANGLTVGDVAAALAASNTSAPGGVLRGGSAEVVIRTEAEWTVAAEALDTPILTTPSGGTLRLRDLGTVRPGFKDALLATAFQGRRAAGIAVVKATDANALEIREAVGKATARFKSQGRLPPGLEIGFVADTTVRIRDRVAVLTQNIAVGSALVFVILGIFLGFRMATLALMGVGFAFLATFIGLCALGESINVLSLFGLVLVAGILVDDAIIVIENVVRRRELGEDIQAAAVSGVAEVAWPVFSSVLTTIAAFLPLLLMTGVTGEFFSVIPISVCIALAFSLFEALTILPIHIADVGIRSKPKDGRGGDERTRVERIYGRLLALATRHRYATVFALVLVSAGAAASFRYIQVFYFPSDFQLLFVNAKLPPDASLAETEGVLDRVQAAALDLGGGLVESTLSTAGWYYDSNYQPHMNVHYGQVLVTLARDRLRAVSTKQVIALLREALARTDLGRGAIEIAELSDGPPIGRPVTVRVQMDDLEELRRVSREVAALVAAVPGVKDVQTNLEVGKHEALAVVDEERAAATGLTAGVVGAAVTAANDGVIATRFKGPDEDWDVRVRVAPEARRTVADLGAVRVRTGTGALVPVSQVARLAFASGFAAIARHDRKRTVTITGDVDPAVTSSIKATGEIDRRLGPLLAREPALTIGYGGEFEETTRSFRSLEQAFLVALIAIFAILGAQFRSYVQPLIVMSCVPFALLGVIAGLHLVGDPFTVATGLGVVGLVGVAVNDGIVLIDFANGRRKEGLSAEAAVHEAGRLRLRAIFLTTVTTIGGLLPSAAGLGGRSPIWGPMATALCCGLFAQMFLTLLVTPALYVMADDAHRLWMRLTARRRR